MKLKEHASGNFVECKDLLHLRHLIKKLLLVFCQFPLRRKKLRSRRLIQAGFQLYEPELNEMVELESGK